VEMSTPHVAADTLALARAEGLRVKLLPRWYDVDDGDSLDRLLRSWLKHRLRLRPIPGTFWPACETCDKIRRNL